jgi:hypothetical protein
MGSTCVVHVIARIDAGDLCSIDHMPDLLCCLHRIAALLQLEARVVHLHHPWRQPLESYHAAGSAVHMQQLIPYNTVLCNFSTIACRQTKLVLAARPSGTTDAAGSAVL